MPRLQETAYPRFKTTITEQELHEIYSPTPEELAFVEAQAYRATAKVGLLVLLKTFQRLGYFVTLSEVPRRIVAHLTLCAGLSAMPEGLETYDVSHSRSRHLGFIRIRLGVTAYGPAARRVMLTAAMDAAQTKEDLADIINVMLETLVHQRYKLPAFSALERVAITARAAVNRRYYQRIAINLDTTTRARLESLLTRLPAEQALRRNPITVDWHLSSVGAAYYLAGRPQEALASLKQYLARYPNILSAHLTLAAVYSELGKVAEARVEAAEVLRINPKFSLEVDKQREPIKDPAVLERHIAALRKAGLK